MNVKFYLRDLTKEKASLTAGNEQPIWCYVTFNGNRLRLSTQIKVYTNEWNIEKGKIRGSSTEIEKLNQRLKNIRSKAEMVFNNYLIKEEVLTPKILKQELLPILFPEKYVAKPEIKLNLFTFLKEFIKNNPRNIKVGTMKSYLQLVPLLEEYAKINGSPVLEFEAVNKSWGESFSKFLLVKKNHSVNNTDKHIKNIKALMQYSLELELHSNTKYIGIKREKVETVEISLKEEEIKAIYELEIDERYRATKDIFVFSCLTGLRISDIINLKKHNWKQDFLNVQTIKTGEILQIPLRKTAKKILQKYHGELPTIYEQKYNKQLKYIAELIPSLQSEEIVYSTKGGIKTEKKVFKYELVKSHTARRSFATNEYYAGTDNLVIRAITGHKTERDFFNYIKVNQLEKASTLLQSFKKRDF
jgi:integrase